MDELAFLSRLRADSPPAGEDVLASARGQLLERAGGPRPTAGTPARRRRRLALALGAVVVAAGLLAAPIGLDIVAPDGRSLGATAEAAGLLNRAAINARDPVIGPAQYLKVTSRGVHMSVTELADRRRAHYYESDLMEIWIPGDPSRPWVLRRTTEPYRFPSAADERALRAAGALSSRRVELLRARDGAFYGPVQGSWQTPTRQFLAELPHDPDRLLRRVYRDSTGQGPSPDGEALVYVADVLRSGIVPADLRAALFRAATRIPGVGVVENRANLDGRRGVAVGRDEPEDGTRQEIIFDPDSGEVIGEREVNVSAAELPKGMLSSTSVRTRVVDEAP
ncbi:MAG TPA: CU044_5270 family protein [Actinomycetota bacterium]|nr:CU044_5270 family protein [Actinomycetota bacterium]